MGRQNTEEAAPKIRKRSLEEAVYAEVKRLEASGEELDLEEIARNLGAKTKSVEKALLSLGYEKKDPNEEESATPLNLPRAEEVETALKRLEEKAKVSDPDTFSIKRSEKPETNPEEISLTPITNNEPSGENPPTNNPEETANEKRGETNQIILEIKNLKRLLADIENEEDKANFATRILDLENDALDQLRILKEAFSEENTGESDSVPSRMEASDGSYVEPALTPEQVRANARMRIKVANQVLLQIKTNLDFIEKKIEEALSYQSSTKKAENLNINTDNLSELSREFIDEINKPNITLLEARKIIFGYCGRTNNPKIIEEVMSGMDNLLDITLKDSSEEEKITAIRRYLVEKILYFDELTHSNNLEDLSDQDLLEKANDNSSNSDTVIDIIRTYAKKTGRGNLNVEAINIAGTITGPYSEKRKKAALVDFFRQVINGQIPSVENKTEEEQESVSRLRKWIEAKKAKRAAEINSVVEKHESRGKLELGNKIKDLWYKFGDGYNKLPTKTKLAISLTLLAATLATGSVAVTAVSGAWRALGTAGLSVSIERVLAANYSAKIGKERSLARKIVHATEAIAFSTLLAIFGGDILRGNPTAKIDTLREWLGSVVGGESIDQGVSASVNKMLDSELKNDITKTEAPAVQVETPPEIHPATAVETPISPVSPATTSEIASATSNEGVGMIYSAESGDTLYKIIDNFAGETKHLSGIQKTNFIENVLAEIKKDPSSFGISSGDVNKLAVGDQIHIDKILDIASNSKINGESLLEHAETIKSLQNEISQNIPEGLKGSVPTENLIGNFESDSLRNVADTGLVTPTSENIAAPTEGYTQNSNPVENSAREINNHVSSSPSEIEPQAAFQAGMELKQDIIPKTFGVRFLGVPIVDGTEIWEGNRNMSGIKGVLISEIERIKREGFTELPNNKITGFIEQSANFQKTMNLLDNLKEATGLTPKDDETVEKFVLRALTEAKLATMKIATKT